MDPLKVLEATAQHYRSILIYRDHGRVTVRNGEATAPVDERFFLTEFRRPTPFRFELRYRHHVGSRMRTFVINDAPGDTRIDWNVDRPYRQPNSLSSALAIATGISYGAASAVPGLLMTDVLGGSRVTDLREARYLGDDLLDSIVCHRISGQALRADGGQSGRAMILWIERNSFLIRQIEWTIGFGSASVRTAINYDPKVDSLSN